MSVTALVVLVLVALVVSGITVWIVTASSRLRDEIDQLFQTFGRTEPTLAPLRVTVDAERARLVERLEHLTDPRSGTDRGRR